MIDSIIYGLTFFMKERKLVYLLLSLVCVGFILFVLRIYAVNCQQRLLFVRGTVRSGIMMQTEVDEFIRQFNRCPTYIEFTNFFGLIENHRENVTPYKSNRVSSKYDNSGGWFYDDKSGEIRINYKGNYKISFGMQVDVEKINFRPPTKVEAVRFGNSEWLDYSEINAVIDAARPQIGEIIKNWAVTNMVTTGVKN
jgi:hypothetical protein